MRQGYDNNGYLTEETLKYYNQLMKKLNDVKASNFGDLEVDNLRQAIEGWQSTYLSANSINNNFPIALFQQFLNYVKNQYQQYRVQGNPDNKDLENYNYFSLDTTNFYSVDSSGAENTPYKQEVRIPVPEGWDGNYSFVELLVPYGTISELQNKVVTSWGTTASKHPLLPASLGGYGGGFGNAGGSDHFVCQQAGFTRKHALLFYSQFTKDSNIQIEIAKKKQHIDLQIDVDEFVEPFKTQIEPFVCARVTYYKLGV